jgi:hypothetical protein
MDDDDDDDDVDIRRAWESIGENMKSSATESLGYCELKSKSWFHEECPKLLYQRKQATLKWLQNPNHTNGDNLNNIRRKTS